MSAAAPAKIEQQDRRDQDAVTKNGIGLTPLKPRPTRSSLVKRLFRRG